MTLRRRSRHGNRSVDPPGRGRIAIVDCQPRDDGGTIRAPMSFRRNAARCAALVVAAAVLFAAGGAAAQSRPAIERLAGVNLGLQFINDAFMNRVIFRQYDETGFFDAHYHVSKHYSMDADIAVPVWKALGFGIAVSHVAEPTRADLDAQVPNPFFFNFPRTTEGVARSLKRREFGLHLQGQFWRFFGESFLLRVTWGPTIFAVRQDLVSQIVTRESSVDFDRVSLVNHRTRTVTVGGLGVNVGFDGTLFMTERVGLGFNMRHSNGKATVDVHDQTPTLLELGGIHAAGGLRFAF